MDKSPDQTISNITFAVISLLPSLLFMVVSIPVKKRNIIQEAVLFTLLSFGLCLPLYFAGELTYVSQMSASVWSWGTSMKMGVWLFSMSIEERRTCPFILTILSWRRKRVIKDAVVEDDINHPSSADTSPPLAPFIQGKIKHVLIADISEAALHICDKNAPVHFLSAFVHKYLSYLGLSTVNHGFSLTFSGFIHSTIVCMIFAVYLQMQLQLTYDAFMIVFILIHRGASALEKRQLSKYTKEKQAKDLNKTNRIQQIRAVKTYMEEIIHMPPAFDSPWSANSLRDFWGRRWHTYYNECFYRLGYQPIRLVFQLVSGHKASRWLPALSVFVMSGLMHEYFLYVSTGPAAYFYGSPLPRGFFQFTFFASQMFFIGIGDRYFKSAPLGKIYAFASMIITCHLFVAPYIMSGYLNMPRVSFSRAAVNLYNRNTSAFDPIY